MVTLLRLLCNSAAAVLPSCWAMSLFFPPNRGQGLNPWGLFVPPLSAQFAGGPGLSLEEVSPCRTAGCRWHGHPEFGGLCSTCGEGWTPQRLEQLRLLAKEAEAETRARDQLESSRMTAERVTR